MKISATVRSASSQHETSIAKQHGSAFLWNRWRSRPAPNFPASAWRLPTSPIGPKCPRVPRRPRSQSFCVSSRPSPRYTTLFAPAFTLEQTSRRQEFDRVGRVAQPASACLHRGAPLLCRVHLLRVLGGRGTAAQVPCLPWRNGQARRLSRRALAKLMSFSAEAVLCPLCREPNRCAMAGEADEVSGCWCTVASFPSELLAAVPAGAQGKACICQRCVAAHRGVAPGAEGPSPRPLLPP